MTRNPPVPDRPALVDPVARHAQVLLRDTRFDWLRPLARRRALVAVTAAWIPIVGMACVMDIPALPAVAQLLGFGAWWVLQRVVRGMADLPDGYVDERMLAVRNAHYRTAYALLSGATVLPLFVLYMAADAGRVQFVPQARHLLALFSVVMLTALLLPSMLVAWNEPEV
jgi:hypothetical protein